VAVLQGLAQHQGQIFWEGLCKTPAPEKKLIPTQPVVQKEAVSLINETAFLQVIHSC
jgi:hypothetical protein